MSRNPTIIATISAEDKTKAAIETATAAIRELNKAFKSVGQEKLPNNMLGGLDRELNRATQQMNAFKDKTAATRREAATLPGAFREALASLGPLVEMAAGLKLEHFGIETAKKAAEFSHAEILNAYAGMSPELLDKAKSATLEAQKKYPGLSMLSGEHLSGSLYSVMASNEEAEKLFPQLMKYRAVQRARHPEESEEQVDERTHNTLKFAEAMGANSSAESLGRLLEKITKVENFEGKMIRPDDLLGLSKQAGAALKLLSETGQKTAVQLVAEWGGDRTGTFLSAIQKYSAGSGFDNHASALTEMVDAGLLDKHDLIVNKQGKPTGIKQGSESLARLQKLSSDPLSYVREDLVPGSEKIWNGLDPKKRQAYTDAFKQNYAKDIAEHPEMVLTGADGKPVDVNALDAKQVFQLGEIRRLFPNAVAARGMGELFIQMQQFLAKSGKIDIAEGVDKTLETSKKDPVAQMQNFQTAIGNLQTVLGSPIMETAANKLNQLATGIASFTTGLAQFEKDHPGTAKALSGLTIAGTTAAGGALAVGGLSTLLNGFGLKGSALALDRAAAHLDSAAGRLGGVPGTPGNGLPGPRRSGVSPWAIGSSVVASINPALQLGEIDSPEAFHQQSIANAQNDAAMNAWLVKNVPGMSFFDYDPNSKSPAKRIWDWLNPTPAPMGPLNDDDRATRARSSDVPAFRPLSREGIGFDAPAVPAKTEVTGNLTGEVQMHQSIDVTASPLLTAKLNKIDQLTVPMAGKLGETRVGPSSTQPSSVPAVRTFR